MMVTTIAAPYTLKPGSFASAPTVYGVSGEERVRGIGGVDAVGVGVGGRNSRIAVPGDGQHPLAVPQLQRGGQVGAAQIGESGQDADADEADREEHDDRDRPVVGGVARCGSGVGHDGDGSGGDMRSDGQPRPR